MELTLDNFNNLKEKKVPRKDMAQLFGIPEWALKKHITKHGWSKKPTVEYPEAFLNYSEEACYWAGFIAADGCISGNTLKICLGYDDLAHLEKFRGFVQSTHKISTSTDKYYRCEIGFVCPPIQDDLKVNYNIVPNKTLTYTLPRIPSIWFRHYLRGYFDGDGCICETLKPRSQTASLQTSVVGSKLFIPSLRTRIEEELRITGGWVQEGANCMTLAYNTNNSFILLDYMYKDSLVYLDRKHEHYTRLSNGIRKRR